LGVAQEDTAVQADWLINKIVELRIFEDKAGKMNLSALEYKAEFLVVSQFTLYGSCDKGRRPSFDEAADPQKAEELYNYFVEGLKKHQVVVATGRFRAMMDVSLVNDGPVTFILESNADH
jgi:D-tyrosyl-tRNA(Tyr) deacylase